MATRAPPGANFSCSSFVALQDIINGAFKGFAMLRQTAYMLNDPLAPPFDPPLYVPRYGFVARNQVRSSNHVWVFSSTGSHLDGDLVDVIVVLQKLRGTCDLRFVRVGLFCCHAACSPYRMRGVGRLSVLDMCHAALADRVPSQHAAADGIPSRAQRSVSHGTARSRAGAADATEAADGPCGTSLDAACHTSGAVAAAAATGQRQPPGGARATLTAVCVAPGVLSCNRQAHVLHMFNQASNFSIFCRVAQYLVISLTTPCVQSARTRVQKLSRTIGVFAAAPALGGGGDGRCTDQLPRQPHRNDGRNAAEAGSPCRCVSPCLHPGSGVRSSL